MSQVTSINHLVRRAPLCVKCTISPTLLSAALLHNSDAEQDVDVELSFTAAWERLG